LSERTGLADSPRIASITCAVWRRIPRCSRTCRLPFSSSTIVWISGWWTCSGSPIGTSSIVSPRKSRIGTGRVVEKRMRRAAYDLVVFLVAVGRVAPRAASIDAGEQPVRRGHDVFRAPGASLVARERAHVDDRARTEIEEVERVARAFEEEAASRRAADRRATEPAPR
jgi:hypothetical protein